MDNKFGGFDKPRANYSKLPHEFVDAFPIMRSQAEIKVVLYILRHTWGYHDGEKKITVDEFCNGRKRKDGTRIDNGTGLSKPSVLSGIKSAIEHGFITVEVDDSDKARVKKYYALRGKESLPLGSRIFTPEVKKLDTDQRKILKKETKKDSLPQKGKGQADPFSGIEGPPAKPKTDYVQACEQMESAFAETRGCSLPDWEQDPKAANKRWRSPLAKKWREKGKDTDLMTNGIREVTRQMMDDGLTFDAPDQIIKCLSSWLIDHNGNGKPASATVYSAPAEDTRKTIAELKG